MKECIKLSVEAEGNYSGSTYYEELFLPKKVWNEIQDDVRMHMNFHGLDGKHSEIQANIEWEHFSEKELQHYMPSNSNDSSKLLDHVCEYLDIDTYDNEYLKNIQKEVASLRQVDTMTIKFNTNDRDTILTLLKDYIL